jgi:methylenetetrahydrofolate dehydrogenase (NADP+) / methenyltetrahydrofolate cyclohydrolase
MTATPSPTARIIDGKARAAALVDQVAEAAARLKADTGTVPGLAAVLVGEDPASRIYVKSKGETAARAGLNSFTHRLGAETTEAELLDLVAQLNADPAVHGILVQLPLPAHIRETAVLAAIDPDKDVDGFHVINA